MLPGPMEMTRQDISMITTSPIPSPPTNQTTIKQKQNTRYIYTELEDYVTIIILALLSCWIVIGNALVITVFLRDKLLRTTTNYYIFSLCISDFIIGLFVVNFFTVYVAQKGWYLGVDFCVLWLMVDYGVYQATVFGVLVITVDRFLLIKYPFIKRLRIRTSKRVKIVILMAWLLSLSLWVPAIVYYIREIALISTRENECRLPSKEDQAHKGVIFATSFISYIIPVVIIVYMATHTYSLLKKSKKMKERVLRGEGQKRRKFGVGSQQNEMMIATSTPKNDNGTISMRKSISDSFVHGSKKRTLPLNHEGSFSEIRSLAYTKERKWSTISFQRVTKKISHARIEMFRSFDRAEIDSPNLSLRRRVVEVQKISTFVLLMAAAFSVTILPLGVLSILRMYIVVQDRYWRLVYVLAYLNSALNPLCYAFGNRNFNEAMRALIKRKSVRADSSFI